MAGQRKYYIDFLKALGLLLVILAHVDPPAPVTFLRCFDVPLLVIISGLLANGSLSKTQSHYFVRRFKRLVFPTWIMLAFLFIILAVTGTVYSTRYYIDSFLLTRYGIGFVWIVLIFLYCALLAPFIRRNLSFRPFWFVLALVYCLYETAYHFQIGTDNLVILSTLYYIIPFGVLTALGMKYPSMTRRAKMAVCAAGFLLFAASAVYYYFSLGGIQLPTIAKYPPRLYFLSFSITVSFLLLMLCEGRENRLFRSRPVLFLSTHSLWIYLWHVFYLTVSNRLSFTDSWILKYGIILLLSITTVWFQNLLLDKLETRFKWSVPKYLRG